MLLRDFARGYQGLDNELLGTLLALAVVMYDRGRLVRVLTYSNASSAGIVSGSNLRRVFGRSHVYGGTLKPALMWINKLLLGAPAAKSSSRVPSAST